MAMKHLCDADHEGEMRLADFRISIEAISMDTLESGYNNVIELCTMDFLSTLETYKNGGIKAGIQYTIERIPE